MSTRQQYQNPPLIEALCELFYEDSPWDKTSDGRFYEVVKADFPDRREAEIHEARFRFPAESEPEAGVRVATRMQFVSVAGDRLIQVARDLVVVNQLRPYPGFDAWEPTVRKAAEAYDEITGAGRPVAMGMRYINRVVVPAAAVALEDLFKIYPHIPGNWPDHSNFMIRVERSLAPAESMILTFATAEEADAAKRAFLLDLYVRYDKNGPLVDLGSAARRIHDQIERTFEASITDRLRQLFR